MSWSGQISATQVKNVRVHIPVAGVHWRPGGHACMTPHCWQTLKSVHSVNSLRFWFHELQFRTYYVQLIAMCVFHNFITINFTHNLTQCTLVTHEMHMRDKVLCLDVCDIEKHCMHTGDPVSALCLQAPERWLWLLLVALITPCSCDSSKNGFVVCLVIALFIVAPRWGKLERHHCQVQCSVDRADFVLFPRDGPDQTCIWRIRSEFCGLRTIGASVRGIDLGCQEALHSLC